MRDLKRQVEEMSFGIRMCCIRNIEARRKPLLSGNAEGYISRMQRSAVFVASTSGYSL